MPVTNEKDLNRQIQDAKEMILMLLEMDDGEKRELNDISWDNNTRSILLHTPLATFPGGEEPEPNTHVMFDNRSMKILEVANNMGVLDITLTAMDPREY